jgi:hypothetical protein
MREEQIQAFISQVSPGLDDLLGHNMAVNDFPKLIALLFMPNS